MERTGNKTKKQERFLYPDICKCIAIFLVTCSHCAQYISGQNWTNFAGGTYLDIAFNMPLFMLISGWFINIDRIRETKAKDYIISKAKRLLLPAIIWYAVLSIVSHPSTSVVSFYWYLTALFACLCIMMIFAKLIKNNKACILLSTAFVLLCPKMDYVNINFMFPFLWGGVFLRKIYESKWAKLWFCVSLIIGGTLALFWNPEYTVYLCPLDVLHFNVRMLIVYLYRFTLGLALSSVVIYLVMRFEKQMSVIAKYGNYSLVVYTGSFVLNALLSIALTKMDYHTNQILIIDFLSVIASLTIYSFIVLLANFFRKYKITRLLFLGE